MLAGRRHRGCPVPAHLSPAPLLSLVVAHGWDPAPLPTPPASRLGGESLAAGTDRCEPVGQGSLGQGDNEPGATGSTHPPWLRAAPPLADLALPRASAPGSVAGLPEEGLLGARGWGRLQWAPSPVLPRPAPLSCQRGVGAPGAAAAQTPGTAGPWRTKTQARFLLASWPLNSSAKTLWSQPFLEYQWARQPWRAMQTPRLRPRPYPPLPHPWPESHRDQGFPWVGPALSATSVDWQPQPASSLLTKDPQGPFRAHKCLSACLCLQPQEQCDKVWRAL